MLVHKVECFCDDTKVTKVTRALAGIGVLDCKVTPVQGAGLTNGALHSTQLPGLTPKQSILLQALPTKRRMKLTDMRAIGEGVGIVNGSLDQLVSSLVKAKKLRRIGRGQYEVRR